MRIIPLFPSENQRFGWGKKTNLITLSIYFPFSISTQSLKVFVWKERMRICDNVMGIYADIWLTN